MANFQCGLTHSPVTPFRRDNSIDYDTYAKLLSPVRAAQFAQIEHRVGTVIDLVIAAHLPLIQHEEVAASTAGR